MGLTDAARVGGVGDAVVGVVEMIALTAVGVAEQPVTASKIPMSKAPRLHIVA